MTTSPVRLALCCSAVGGFLLQAGLLAAAKPGEVLLPPDVPLPVDAQPIDNPAARQAISRMLMGDPDAATDQTLPAEFKDLLRSTRSVLDGSSLDPDLELLNQRSTKPLHTAPLPKSARQRRRAAEMLLKSARLLDKIEPKSENQSYLVNQMHKEAVRLLKNSTRQSPPRPTP